MDSQYKYFLFSEFDSRKGSLDNNVDTYFNGSTYITDSGKNNFSPETLKKLDDARDIIEREWNIFNSGKIIFKINSGFRTVSRNADEGGVVNSAHTVNTTDRKKSRAADISWVNYNQQQKDFIIYALKKVGFNRFGIASSFVHVDNDMTKPQNATWYY